MIPGKNRGSAGTPVVTTVIKMYIKLRMIQNEQVTGTGEINLF